MKFGLFGVNMHPCTTPEAIARAAHAAEAAGFDSLWGGEHIVLADPQAPPSPMPPRTQFVDLCAAMAYAAAHTRALRLATGIIILPLRNPVVLAKQLASVDVVSNGRLMFGVGIGNLRFEFDAVGMPFDRKGLRAEEALGVIKALWTMERPRYAGRFFRLDGVRAEPRPLQRPHPPIIFGGKTTHAFSRTARLGDGWFGYGLGLEAAAQCIEGIRRACAEHGREFERIEISVTPRDRPDRELVRRYAELGVSRIVVAPRVRGIDEFVRAIEEAADELVR
ncbi:MAG TPA: TIGR03619 family F420-dependent LLM class oxidoreductase [Candidatus Binataceae bacterium]|jgi:probable F420-dependent oxidoreductase|nr:TIGR03619 family F420-dependent LLM class oxidoreductase [Candidatus Binataceae bacterium]